MRTLFFLGAGASYGRGDCLFNGQNSTHNTPPLGMYLYHALCDFSPGSGERTSDLASLFRSDFERGMVAAGDKGLAPYIQKLTALYLFLIIHDIHPDPV